MSEAAAPARAGPWARWQRLGLTRQILLGLALGAGLGVFFGESARVLEPVAEVYIRLMQMTVLPYLILTLIVGLGRMDAAQARTLAWRGGLALLAFWALALLVIGLMPLAFPGIENASFFS
ncbi:MAG TPA: cation:dicarboxylase symporter family transporter, partial [Burkholderiaceae bacterium]|nr:cation:dicarboxylase symporter family transporter [Burkholderiaceae bacterium]